MMLSFLDDLRANFPNAEIVYKLGNHDERYERYIIRKAPMMWDFSVLGLDYLINVHGKNEEEQQRARNRKITVVGHKKIVKMGKLNLVHGHEFGKSIFSPVNPARGLYLRSKVNAICGHHHQTSEHVEKDMNNNITGCWSVGCLSDLHPEYMPINKFNHGFAFIEIDEIGNFSIENKKIMNGSIV